jgi:alkylation response protein AidB-like acyl-CoA dehydrogenase
LTERRATDSIACVDFLLGDEAEGLRLRLRGLLEEHLPRNYLSPFTQDPVAREQGRAFTRLLADEGLLTIGWPREYGGGGAGLWVQTVIREEMWAHYEPRGSQYMGLNWAGPAIMRFGTDEQKRTWLPRIAAGEVNWAQGFSEPEAGSDLASLRTRATPVDGGWRINGQKIWTSYAQAADVCFLAVRTGTPESRHRGITIFLVPMDRPGIEVRGIDSLMGHDHINEVFFTDLDVTEEDLLGAVDGGWSVIRHVLANERVGIARYARNERVLNRWRVEEADVWETLPEAVRSRLTRALVHARVARLLAYRVVDEMSRDEVSDVHAAVARLAVTALDQETGDALMEAEGPRSLDGKGVPDAPLGGAIEDLWRYSRASTVASGAREILLSVLARDVFGDGRGPGST